ncbi:MAG: ABC transporter permease, partial [Rhodobacteraceae bacterium]|nr:ABC transporter permease [Paracoccaceae bacterium]
MQRYLLKRLVSLALSLLVASLVIFAAIEVVPGDPASYMLGLNASEDTVAALRDRLGLNEPVPLRYLRWVVGMVQGDFGQSYTYKVAVAELVAQRMVVSLPLALYALVLAVVIAFPAGLLAAAKRGRVADAAVMGATQVGIALPNFWFAMLLVLV